MAVRMMRADAMQAHPSRHGTYDGISMNPYETVFIKASWHVGEPFAAKYAAWQTTILKGGNGAEGEFDEPMYRFGIECAFPNCTHRCLPKSPSRNCSALVRTLPLCLTPRAGRAACQAPAPLSADRAPGVATVSSLFACHCSSVLSTSPRSPMVFHSST